MEGDRLPPHDVAAEEAVLGSLLIDDEAIVNVADFLHPEDFYDIKTKPVFEACLALYQSRQGINQITVAHQLVQRNQLETVGGVSYLSYLVSIVPTSVHVTHYANIVHRTATYRRLISAAGQIAAVAYQGGPDTDEVLDRAEELLFKLRRGQSTRDFVALRKLLDDYFEQAVEAPDRREGQLPYIVSDFLALDEIMGGFNRSDLIILAARPSLGKTSLVLNIARNAAAKQGAHVAVFSLEMAREQVVQRFLASESGVDTRRLRFGYYNEDEEREIMHAAGRLSELPIYIDDSPVLGAMEMRSKARRLASEVGVDMVIVDYLQLIHGGNGYENRVQEIGFISRSLKAMARELNVPVLAVSQLSRAVEIRTPHIPLLSDLRESGSLEQDSDIVMFIYREDVYTTKEEWERRHPLEPYPRGIAEIIVAKHRNGPTGKVPLRFLERTVRFTNLEVSRN
ncbi:MAG: replicative DNA helicase [Chloroflexi bacterium]|nr:replicative DNA helicase [Chloroflexota bacterium]